MLTIMHDPAGITGRERHPWDCTRTLQENLALHLDGGADCDVRINGVSVDPVTDARFDMPPSLQDQVTISRRPEGIETALLWVYAAIAAYAVYAYATAPGAEGMDAVAKDSPNNKLTAQSNVARAYQAIPDVYGYRRVWPDLIQPSTVEYVDNIKFVTEWLCVSRGKGSISAVQYAETPIGDIDGSSYEIFEPVAVGGYPEFGETTLNDVFEAFASDEVNGQELPYAVAFSSVYQVGTYDAAEEASTFTVTFVDGPNLAQLKSVAPGGTAQVAFQFGVESNSFNEVCVVISYLVSGANVTFTFSCSPWVSEQSGSTDILVVPSGVVTHTQGPYTLPVVASRIWWSTAFLRGLKGAVYVRAEWWQVNGSGEEVPGTRQQQDNVYGADTFDQRFYTVKVTPAAGSGRYRIQFTRMSGLANDQGADVAKLEELYAVRHHATKVLPGVTVLRVTTKATLAATGFSDRKFNVRWARHVRALGAATLSTSRNFARIMAHIWTIARNDIAGLDTAALAQVNDELGEDSPLLRFDGSMDDADMSLGERLQLVANNARCTVWRDGLKWTITRDQARQYPEIQLDYRNLAAGGDSTISVAAHLPASNDGVEVEYVDEATQAKKTYVRLNISTGSPVVGVSVNPRKIRLPGCTTAAQAENRAQLEARRLIFQRTSVSDTALADAAMVGLGAMVRWIDPNDFGGDDGLQAGEVLAIDGDRILTSEPIDWKGEGSGRILLTGADGKHLGAPVVCFPDGDAVHLATVPEGLYVADADRQLGSRYAFAVGLTEAEVESAGLYTTTEIRPAADGTVSIALTQYDARIYEADA